MPNHLANPDACDVSFWDFAMPVAFGSLAGLAAGFAARRLMIHEKPHTQEAIASVAHAAAFWIFGGVTFVLRQRRMKR